MKINIAPTVSLAVGIAGLVTAYVTGFLSTHPDVVVVLGGIQQILAHWLPPLASKEQP